MALLNALLLLAAESPGPGRGENADDGIGLGIILGIAAAFLLALVAVGLVVRSRAASRRTNVPEREPHDPGRVGRIR